MNRHSHFVPSMLSRARGVTLVELLITMTIATFLLGGLLTIVMNTRNTFGNQNALAQLQDSERVAMTLLGDVIQEAGYFTDPTVNTLALALPADALFPGAGRSIIGTRTAGAPEDTISVRYLTAPGDGIINCTGASNPIGGGVNILYENTFSIDVNGNLVCSVNGAAPAVLISGITNLRIWYGVEANTALGNGAVDSWLRANEMTASNWNNVIAVKVIIFFTNPLAAQPNQPATIRIERVVGVMNKGGVKT